MAEVVGLIASVLTLVKLAQGVCSGIHELHSILGGLPGRLVTLSNEVADLELVLGSVQACLRQRNWQDYSAFDGVLPILAQARTHLSDLRLVILQIKEAGSDSKLAPLQRAYAWKRHHSRLNELQDKIVAAKGNLQVIMGALTSNDIHLIQTQLADLSTVTRAFIQESSLPKAELQDFFVTQNQLLADQVTRVVTEQVTTVLDRIGQRTSERRYRPRLPPSKVAPLRQRTSSSTSSSSSSMSSDRSDDSVSLINASSQQPPAPPPYAADAVQVRVASQTTWCPRGCGCSCHKPQQTGHSAGMANRFLGALFVGYSGLPVLSAACDADSCKRSEAPHVQAEYWFPLGLFWSKIFQLQATYEPATGPSLQLRMMRRVPDTAAAVNFSLNGNVDGLKDLFRRGLASPVDISDTRGYSLLRWALYAQQWDTCRFLLNAGADPDYRPKALSDNSPRNKASDLILQGGLSAQAIEVLMQMSRREDWLEDQNLPLLHRIVTEISGKDIVEAINENPGAINDRDNMGRTALLWAAARGDDASVAALLMHGADPNLMDCQHAGPVSYAADRNHAGCVLLLLEAGADPDPVIPGGYKIGSPLNCAARNATDPEIIKSLLEFRAKVDACGVDGRTSLIHAARTDNVDFTLLLLEYNANINAVSTAGQTPLTTAIMNNSHGVLQLLLSRWGEYADCPRLKGPNLLKLTAQYANHETIKILLDTNHFRLKHDKTYTTGDFETLLRQRSDVDKELDDAFLELMSAVRREADVQSHGNKCPVREHGLRFEPSESVEEYAKRMHDGGEPDLPRYVEKPSLGERTIIEAT